MPRAWGRSVLGMSEAQGGKSRVSKGETGGMWRRNKARPCKALWAITRPLAFMLRELELPEGGRSYPTIINIEKRVSDPEINKL